MYLKLKLKKIIKHFGISLSIKNNKNHILINNYDDAKREWVLFNI